VVGLGKNSGIHLAGLGDATADIMLLLLDIGRLWCGAFSYISSNGIVGLGRGVITPGNCLKMNGRSVIVVTVVGVLLTR